MRIACALLRWTVPIRIVLALATALTPAAVVAKTTMVIDADVQRTCNVAALPMMFGTIAVIFANATAQASIFVDCTPSTSFTIAIDNGQNFNGQRRMARIGPGFGNFLNYEIYRDAARAQRWGTTPAQVVTRVAPANGKMTLLAYGRATGSVAAGPFEDTVTVTITL